MRILVTGSRDWTDRVAISRSILRHVNDACPMVYHHGVPMWRNTDDVVIVHGGARGADQLTEQWATGGERPFKTEVYALTRADWQGNPRTAGYIRNAHMVDLGADVCIAFLMPCTKDDCPREGLHYSHGATMCSDLAERKGIETYRVYR